MATKRATPKQAKAIKKALGRKWQPAKIRKSKSGRIEVKVSVRKSAVKATRKRRATKRRR
jgi:hypothetical protein